MKANSGLSDWAVWGKAVFLPAEVFFCLWVDLKLSSLNLWSLILCYGRGVVFIIILLRFSLQEDPTNLSFYWFCDNGILSFLSPLISLVLSLFYHAHFNVTAHKQQADFGSRRLHFAWSCCIWFHVETLGNLESIWFLVLIKLWRRFGWFVTVKTSELPLSQHSGLVLLCRVVLELWSSFGGVKVKCLLCLTAEHKVLI